jgi:hypothetical protein
MARRDIELDLEAAFRKGVRRCNALGYNPAYFVRMLDEHGALLTARQLIAAGSVSEGFERLWELGHLELTVEAIVLRPEFASLFTERELRVARRRLEELGYDAPQ